MKFSITPKSRAVSINEALNPGCSGIILNLRLSGIIKNYQYSLPLLFSKMCEKAKYMWLFITCIWLFVLKTPAQPPSRIVWVIMCHGSLCEVYCFSPCPCFFSNTCVLYAIWKGFWCGLNETFVCPSAR